jgi:hypothetical protein
VTVADLVDVEAAIDAMPDHGLTGSSSRRLPSSSTSILSGSKETMSATLCTSGQASLRPSRPGVVAHVVVASQPRVRAERLPVDSSQAASSTSARGTYQRGANPDSYGASGRVESTTTRSPSRTTR